MIATAKMRAALCALAMAAVAAAFSPGLMRPQASAGLTISVGTCHNLNPAVTQSALTAVRSDDRPWDQISSVLVTPGPTVTANAGTFSVSYSQLEVAITTCATALPTFPDPTTGDVTAQWLACFDPGTSMPIATAPDGVLIGHGAGGLPLFDGPYPSNQGYRFCGWASQSAGANDYGVAVYDPVGAYAEYDRADLVDSTLTATTVTPATWTIGGGAVVVNLYIPYDWVVTTPSGSGSFTTVDPILTAGATVGNFVAQTQGGPPGVVQPASAHCTPGIQTQSAALCTPAVNGLQSLTPVDWAPGSEWCVMVNVGCAMYATGGFADGYDLSSDVKSKPAATVVPLNVSQPCLGPSQSCIASQPPTYSFDYGRFLDPVMTSPPFSATRRYLPDGASFTA